FIVAHPDRFFAALLRHVELSAAALTLAIALAVPVGVWLAAKPRAALSAITLANIGRTLPSLAVLALLMPVLGTGFAPSWLALPQLLVGAIPATLLSIGTDQLFGHLQRSLTPLGLRSA